MTVPDARRRWLVHPAAFAVALVLAGGLGAVAAFRQGPAAAWPALLLVAVAGATAGFANSGST
jgi:hypothetical protein